MAEAFTGIETDLTLLEWSRPQPSADAAAEPRGAGHVRAHDRDREPGRGGVPRDRRESRCSRASGAYYHDIGKIAKPQYFVENQAKGRNPHDTLKPDASAQIIRNHVREGLELADAVQACRARCAPSSPSITARARSRYFLEQAREQRGAGPTPHDFVYPGPLPQSAGDGRRDARRRHRGGGARASRPDAREDSRRGRTHRAPAHRAGTAARRAAHAAADRDHQGASSRACSSACITTASTIRRRAAAITSEFASV